MTISGRSIWFAFVAVWAALWVGLATTNNAAFLAAAGVLAFAGSVALGTNFRGAARWFWLRYQRSALTSGLDLKTIRLVGRFGAVLSASMVLFAVPKLVTG